MILHPKSKLPNARQNKRTRKNFTVTDKDFNTPVSVIEQI